MQEVLQDLGPLEKQGKVEGFFKNTENAAQLGGLVEGIRDAMMEYQVCALNSSSPPRLRYLSQTSLQQGIYDQHQRIYAKQQDIDHRVLAIMVNSIPSPLIPAV